MQKFLQRAFGLQPQEMPLIFAFSFLIFGNSLARWLSSKAF
jgi:hypothetical protein